MVTKPNILRWLASNASRMTKLMTRTPTLFLLCFIVVPHQIVSAVGVHGGGGGQYSSIEEEEKPSLGKMLLDKIHLLRKSHKSSLERIRKIIYELQLLLFRPSLYFGGRNEENAEAESSADHGAGEKMKEAAKRSIGESKTAVEESAKSAAEAVHITAGKVVEALSDSEETHDEL